MVNARIVNPTILQLLTEEHALKLNVFLDHNSSTLKVSVKIMILIFHKRLKPWKLSIPCCKIKWEKQKNLLKMKELNYSTFKSNNTSMLVLLNIKNWSLNTCLKYNLALKISKQEKDNALQLHHQTKHLCQLILFIKAHTTIIKLTPFALIHTISVQDQAWMIASRHQRHNVTEMISLFSSKLVIAIALSVTSYGLTKIKKVAQSTSQ